MPDNPGLKDYLKAAFFVRPNVPVLGDVPVNMLALAAIGVAGFINPGLWLLGLGAELGFVTWLSHDPRFQNLVNGQRLRERAQGFQERLRAISTRLPPDARARWLRLQAVCSDIRQAAFQLTGPDAPAGGSKVDEVQESGINSLLMIHARLLLSRVALVQYATDSVGKELTARIAEAQDRLAHATSDGMKRSVEGTLDILKKRMTHHDSARQNLDIIDSELDRIENQAQLLREDASVARDPEILSARIDAVAATMGDVNQFLASSEGLLSDLDSEPSLGGSSSVASASGRSKTTVDSGG